jgi:hypothetical protein
VGRNQVPLQVGQKPKKSPTFLKDNPNPIPDTYFRSLLEKRGVGREFLGIRGILEVGITPTDSLARGRVALCEACGGGWICPLGLETNVDCGVGWMGMEGHPWRSFHYLLCRMPRQWYNPTS